MTSGTTVLHDDGHPLRPIRRPPVPASPAGRLAVDHDDALLAGLRAPRVDHGAATVAAPGLLEYADGALRMIPDPAARPARLGALPAPSDPRPEPSVRATAAHADAWVELEPTAWLITLESGHLVRASDLVFRLLGRTHDELSQVLSDPGDAVPGLTWIRRTVIAYGRADMVLRVRTSDGSVRVLDVASQRLPRRRGAGDRYFSVLSPRVG